MSQQVAPEPTVREPAADRPGNERPQLRAFAVVVAALLALAVGGAFLSPTDERAAADSARAKVQVNRASITCPDPRVGGAGFPVAVHMLTPDTAASRGEGRAVVAALRPEGSSEVRSVDAPGRLESVRAEDGDVTAVTVEATGGMAAGIVAEQVSTITSGQMRGLAAGECPRPGNDFWFVGGGSEVGHRTSVLLTNPDPTPATVDVTVYGKDGRLRTSTDDESHVVEAGGQEVLRLDAFASGSEVTAVRVHASAGRVAAAVFDTQVDGLSPRGSDWVPQAGEPAREVVVPGLPAGSGPRLLHLIAPGGSDAVVELTLVTPERAFAPTDQEVIDVPAGRVVTADLTEAVNKEAAALRLRSDVPVLAGAEVRTGSETGTSEVGYSAAAPALDGPTAAVGIPRGEGSTAELLLTAPGRPATVSVTTLSGGGERRQTRSVRVDERSTKVVKLSGAGDTFGVVLTVSGGPVHAARVVEQESADASLVTVLPLRTSPSTVSGPAVTADLSTALRLGG